MKKSPFALLRESIEEEFFNLSLELQLLCTEEEKVNHDFILGYRSALEILRARANFIYKHGTKPPF